MAETVQGVFPLADGTVYSARKNVCPFSTPPLEAYVPVVGEASIERLHKAAQRVRGLNMLALNSTAQGGGVAEMLYSSIPFANSLGVKAEWKVVKGNKEYFEITKYVHNLLQGHKGPFTRKMLQTYFDNLEQCAKQNIIDYDPDVVDVHDPQPLGLNRYLKKPNQLWVWRCHIDIEDATPRDNPALWEFVNDCAQRYDAAVFSAAQYVVASWPLPKFIIPPFIDPLSEKNRELSRQEIDDVLFKYQVDPKVPIIAQIGRFDPWKGLDRTIATYRYVRKEKKCQLVLAGGLASDDPEGVRILAKVYEETKNEEDIHVLNLSMADRLENYREVNALQRAATVIMQPSTREGFGLVITEALWKGKPVVGAEVGGIPLQIRCGYNGYFYQTPRRTAERIVRLLESPATAALLGQRGHAYVKDHFLLPDRMADYFMAIDMSINMARNREYCSDCIISFHPWFKLSRRE